MTSRCSWTVYQWFHEFYVQSSASADPKVASKDQNVVLRHATGLHPMFHIISKKNPRRSEENMKLELPVVSLPSVPGGCPTCPRLSGESSGIVPDVPVWQRVPTNVQGTSDDAGVTCSGRILDAVADVVATAILWLHLEQLLCSCRGWLVITMVEKLVMMVG